MLLPGNPPEKNNNGERQWGGELSLKGEGKHRKNVPPPKRARGEKGVMPLREALGE